MLQQLMVLTFTQVRSLSLVKSVENVSQPRAHCRLTSESTGQLLYLIFTPLLTVFAPCCIIYDPGGDMWS